MSPPEAGGLGGADRRGLVEGLGAERRWGRGGGGGEKNVFVAIASICKTNEHNC